jgi:hypothetical protein
MFRKNNKTKKFCTPTGDSSLNKHNKIVIFRHLKYVYQIFCLSFILPPSKTTMQIWKIIVYREIDNTIYDWVEIAPERT